MRRVFQIPRIGAIAGCLVIDGMISRNAEVRLIREGETVHKGRISSLKHLKENGYLYDSSVCPCIAIPLIKAVQWFQYKKGVSEYGGMDSVFAPLYPYLPDKDNPYRRGDMPLLEIPVSTIPVLKIPFHFSFINIVGPFLYLTGRFLSKVTDFKFLNYAFHAVDILDMTNTPKALHSRPGIKKKSRDKIRAMNEILRDIRENYSIMTTSEIAKLYGQKN